MAASKPASGVIGKVPPQNIDAEVAVLGAMLLAPDAVHRAEEILTEIYAPVQ